MSNDSSILRLCKCHRPFDVISGQPLRMEPNEWVPSGWKISSQPCKLCDPDFYRKHAMEHLKDTIKNGESKEGIK